MSEMLKVIITEENGQGMVEYGLIIAGISLAAIAAIWLFGDKILALLDEKVKNFSDKII